MLRSKEKDSVNTILEYDKSKNRANSILDPITSINTRVCGRFRGIKKKDKSRLNRFKLLLKN